jgi:ABC-2 type transport system permease protein
MLLYRQFVMEWKLFSRDRVAMFWTFAFPLLMLAGFGTIFRSGANPAITLVVAGDPAGSELMTALRFTPVKVVALSQAEAETRWKKGDTSAQLDFAGGAPHLKVNTYLAAQGHMAAQIVQQANLAVQLRRQGQDPAWIPITLEGPARAAHAANYAAFLLPGLLGMNLMSMGLFAVGMVNVSYREKGKFRRLAVTPLPKWIFLAGQVLHRLTVTFLQSALMLVMGYFAFGISNQGSFLLLAAIMGLGTACFMAMGFALASFAQTSEGYAAISNAFFFPMMFLSGVYFGLDAAPRWLQQAVVVLPLSPFLKALRGVFNEGGGLAGHGVGLAIVGAWTAACFLLAVKRFKWA